MIYRDRIKQDANTFKQGLTLFLLSIFGNKKDFFSKNICFLALTLASIAYRLHFLIKKPLSYDEIFIIERFFKISYKQRRFGYHAGSTQRVFYCHPKTRLP